MNIKNKDHKDLTETIDAILWADEWLKTIAEHPEIPQDRETMITWFSNALMVGYDKGRNIEEHRWLSAGMKFPASAINNSL